MNSLILVNKENTLPKDYIPEGLVEIKDDIDRRHDIFESFNQEFKVKIVDFVFESFLEMQVDAFKSGYKIIVDTAYRSYEYQEKVNYLEKIGEEAYTFVAPPGSSEHQTGLCFDVALIVNGNYCDDFDDSAPEIKWLIDNSYKYGFILRYPKDKIDITGYKYEPWHYRYVGKEEALYMKENNLTLEEYKNKNTSLKCFINYCFPNLVR